MDALDPIFNTFPLSGVSGVVEGYGNTFSDFIGAFIGTSIGNLVLNAGKVSNTPLWVEPVAIIFGCLAGAWVPGIAKKYNKLKLLVIGLIAFTIIICIVLAWGLPKSKKTPVETESTEPETQESVVNPVQATTNAAPVNTTQTQTTQVETTPVETTPAPTQTTQVPVNAQPEEETSA